LDCPLIVEHSQYAPKVPTVFATFTVHVCAVLFHTLVVRDRLLDRMALWRTKPAAPRSDETEA
jgi:hypothetical protein